MNDDQTSALAHRGTLGDFLARHQRECAQYDRATEAARREFAATFIPRIADTRNLRLAAEHLAEGGDKAPGPNGQHIHRLRRENPSFVWQQLRNLSSALQDQTYQPGPTRRANVPKSSGQGTRPIDIPDWQDQVVQRAIVQTLDPFVDHQFDELSLGYRTGHDRFEAIAKTGVRVELENRRTAVCADLSNAFTTIPHALLLAEVERRTGNQQLTQLVGRIIRAENRSRGVPQGGSLSAFLLNLFLDRHLDQPWRREFPDVPMIRVADDLLILCRSGEEAEECLATLRNLLRPIGMRLNERKTHTTDLQGGNSADWLGFALSGENGTVRVNLTQDFYTRAERMIRNALSEPDGVLRAAEAIRGLLDQLGPCYPGTDHDYVYRHLASLAARAGFHEFPAREELMRVWRRSAVRYLLQCRIWRMVYLCRRDTVVGFGSGSACSQSFPAFSTSAVRGDGPAVAATINPSATPKATLTVTCVQPSNGVGGWAFHVQFPDHVRTQTRFESTDGQNQFRSVLHAALEGVRRIGPSPWIHIVTDSGFLCSDWKGIVERCRARGGKTQNGDTPANWDLLTALDRELSWRQVTYEFRSGALHRFADRQTMIG